MFRIDSLCRTRLLVLPTSRTTRTIMTAASTERAEGDISAAFGSLSGKEFQPLDARFAQVKSALIAGREEAIDKSWHRLLRSLREETAIISQKKSSTIPEIQYTDLNNRPETFDATVRKHGVAVIRNVIPEDEAVAMKEELQEYIRQNPHTKAYPPEKPQVFELYWSPSQIKARSDPRLLAAQSYLMQLWHSDDENALISTQHPLAYADRLRMRLPGDNKFSLGPHVDSGSCERWESEGYGGREGVYGKIWSGEWEQFDPWEASCRLPMRTDMYNGVGACSAFRMLQGWLSMTHTGPHEGTLLVYPLIKQATAYFLLRPFFTAKQDLPNGASPSDVEAYLASDNWNLDVGPHNSWLHGATPGCGQELRPQLHPHLRLDQAMVHVPRVGPGDYVAWHCDIIHGVDNIHQGSTDSSVMYIPSCPLTVENAEYMVKQRERFLSGTPSPDFGGGIGESQHVGRPGVPEVQKVDANIGMQAFGLKGWAIDQPGLNPGTRNLLKQANTILGFA